MLKQITEMIEQVASGMDCYKGKMSQKNVIHILKSLAYDATQAETELNRLREENERLKPLAEIGAFTKMALKQDYPALTFAQVEGGILITNIEGLLKWGREQKEREK